MNQSSNQPDNTEYEWLDDILHSHFILGKHDKARQAIIQKLEEREAAAELRRRIPEYDEKATRRFVAAVNNNDIYLNEDVELHPEDGWNALADLLAQLQQSTSQETR